MKKTIILPALLVSALSLASCTGNAVYMKTNTSLTPTDPKTIQVYSMTKPSGNYEVIGYVSTYSSEGNDEGDKIKENLRIQAAQYGANAIIGFKLNMGLGGGGGAQGVAIRYVR